MYDTNNTKGNRSNMIKISISISKFMKISKRLPQYFSKILYYSLQYYTVYGIAIGYFATLFNTLTFRKMLKKANEGLLLHKNLALLSLISLTPLLNLIKDIYFSTIFNI